MSNAELSKKVQTMLKDKGILKKQYRIRVRYCGYSTSVNIYITDLVVRVCDVQLAICSLESIRRDEHSGEILSGGNTYVMVEYDYFVMSKAIDDYLPLASDIINTSSIHGNNRLGYNSKSGLTTWYVKDNFNPMYSRVVVTSETDDTYHQSHSAHDEYSLARAMVLFHNTGYIA